MACEVRDKIVKETITCRVLCRRSLYSKTSIKGHAPPKCRNLINGVDSQYGFEIDTFDLHTITSVLINFEWNYSRIVITLVGSTK